MINQIPMEFGEVYYQEDLGQENTGSLIFKLYISVNSNPENIVLNQAHFKGRISELRFNKNQYIATFEGLSSRKPDVVMSADPHAEYGNEIPKVIPKSKFKLKEGECVISYIYHGETKYYKLTNIKKKDPQ